MLNRQKTLLYLIQKAGGSASRINLTKWCFLLRHETASKGGTTFYDFVPYRYGPYSFCLQHEISRLVKKGIIGEPNGRIWQIARECERDFSKPSDVEDVARIMLRYGGMNTDELMEAVYSRYPWFTINSNRPRIGNSERPEAQIGVYTIGYQGLSVDRLLNEVLKSGIRCIADVRNSPQSGTYGFHKSTLSRLCGKLGIKYSSFPELGIQSVSRQDLTTLGDYQKLFQEYREDTLAQNHASLGELSDQIRKEPTALMCMEADRRSCHRSIIAEHLGKSLNLRVVHLDGSIGE